MRIFTYPFVFLASLCFCFTSKAQEKSPDYIITINNDTLRGEVFELNNTTINFRRQGEKTKKTFYAQQIKSYFAYHTNIVVKTILSGGSESPTFLRELLLGYVSFYELAHPTDLQQYYLELPQKSIVALPRDNTSWAVLRTNLLECSSQYFENLMLQKNYLYSETYFKRIIKYYNLCVRPNEQVHEPLNGSKSKYGILLGVGVNNWNYTFDLGESPFYNFNGRLSNELRANFGLFYNLSIRKKFSLEFDVMYNEYSGHRDVPVNNSGVALEPYKLAIVEKYIIVPMLINYDIVSKKRFKLIGKGGPTFGYDFIFDEAKSRDSFSSPIVWHRPNIMFWGYGLGFGIEKEITPKMNLNVDLRYSNHGIRDVGSNSSFQLLVGLGFHK